MPWKQESIKCLPPLARLIRIDAQKQGPASEQLLASLCGDYPDAWQQAERATIEALQSRLDLWDGIAAAIAS